MSKYFISVIMPIYNAEKYSKKIKFDRLSESDDK